MWRYAKETFGGDVLLEKHEARCLSQDAGKAGPAAAAFGEGVAGSEGSAASSMLDVDVIGHAAVGQIGRRGDEEILDLDALGEIGQA
jgi:hypothetical protein